MSINSELTYWEKQAILFTKGHYGTYELEHMKFLLARQYWLEIDQVGVHNFLLTLTKIYDKLVHHGLQTLDSYEFLMTAAKRNNDSWNVNFDCILKEIFARVQGLKVVYEGFSIELGEVDKELYQEIQSAIDDKS